MRRSLKREAKQRGKETFKEEHKKHEDSQFEDDQEYEESEDLGHASEEHSSRIERRMQGDEAPSSFMGFEGDDENATIYHVPSFLLKTYEIVDVRPSPTQFPLRTRSTTR